MPGRHSDAAMLSSLIHHPSPGRPVRCEDSWAELMRAATGSRSLGAVGLGEGWGFIPFPHPACPNAQSVLGTYCVFSSVQSQRWELVNARLESPPLQCL